VARRREPTPFVIFIKNPLGKINPSPDIDSPEDRPEGRIKEARVEFVSCDVLVIGSGAAGLRAAIAAREAGLEVLVISKGQPGKSTCTGFSAGVMAGSPNAAGLETHLERTLKAGRGLNQPELVEILVHEAPARLQELLNWGIRAELLNGYLYSQGHAPVLGGELVQCLLQKNQALGTRFRGGLWVTDLVVDPGLAGVRAYLPAAQTWLAIAAKAVVLATGGAAALFRRHDNPKGMLGDGYRLALKAGAILQDMEFVQFYPLCLAEPGFPPAVIPPKLADCGRLLNDGGEDILEKYGIEERPAAEGARDYLAQSLFKEIYRDGHEVWLDLRALPEDKWRIDPFSAALGPILIKRYGARERPLRVAPAAHHVMGGVKIDPAGATSIAGLFAAGEAAGGLHGANRMAGNALSETLVFGARAGSAAAQWAEGVARGDPRSILPQLQARALEWGGVNADRADLRERLGNIMWEDGGVLRNRAGLTRALEAARSLGQESPGSTSSPAPQDLKKTIEMRSAAQAATLILEAALRRCESRGAHFREDFPNQDDKAWLGHLQVRVTANGKEAWHFQPEELRRS
jgi:succinate dehydrogenase/fumarate reductase flavoprotein subunit